MPRPSRLTASRLAAVIAALSVAGCGGGGESGGEADEGARAYRPCAVCHVSAPPDTRAGQIRLIGPSLWGVYGEEAGQAEDFAYSRAMREANIVWDEETLHAYIENPQAVVRGTRMSFVGEPDPAKRQAIIDYLKTLR